MIVPAALIFINKNPQETQSEKSPWYDGDHETEQSLFPADGFHIQREYFYFPGAQAQGLPAMSPKPGIKEETD